MSYKFVNILGYGYVGGAIGHLCKSNNVPFCTYDVIEKDEELAVKNFSNIDTLINFSEHSNEHNVYFICVPTPPDSDTGECDITIVESVMKELYEKSSKSTSIIIKSTVRPGTSRILSDKYGAKLNVVFSASFGRQLEYYTGMVFKIDIKSKSKNRNIINGGRYDKLISDLGAKNQVPAVGAALNLNY
jgi:UDP-N-acetyl-D-mannosaminuronate dehydrogenase